jgi:hypothetical protein
MNKIVTEIENNFNLNKIIYKNDYIWSILQFSFVNQLMTTSFIGKNTGEDFNFLCFICEDVF